MSSNSATWRDTVSEARPRVKRKSHSGGLTRGDCAILALLFASFWILTPFIFSSSVTGYTTEVGTAGVGFALDSVDSGNPLRWAVLIVLGVAGTLAVVRTRLRGLHVGSPLGWATMVFALLAVVSPLWSADPEVTLRKVGGLVMFGIVALALAERWGLDRVTSAAIVLASGSILIGLVAEVSQNTFRPWQGAYRFSGVMHPNAMGMTCSLLAVGAVSYGLRGRGRRGAYWMLATVAAVLLVLTKSRGALAGFLVAGMVLVAVELRLRSLMLLVCGTAVIGLSTLILAPDILDSAAKAAALGRSDGSNLLTFTGRVSLWTGLLAYVEQHPWLGFGYNSFWSSRHILEIAEAEGWYVGNAHSGYIDVLLSLGWIGLGFFLTIFALALVRAWVLQQHLREPGALFSLLLLCALLTSMVSEVVMSATSISSSIAFILLLRLAWGDNRADHLMKAD